MRALVLAVIVGLAAAAGVEMLGMRGAQCIRAGERVVVETHFRSLPESEVDGAELCVATELSLPDAWQCQLGGASTLQALAASPELRTLFLDGFVASQRVYVAVLRAGEVLLGPLPLDVEVRESCAGWAAPEALAWSSGYGNRGGDFEVALRLLVSQTELAWLRGREGAEPKIFPRDLSAAFESVSVAKSDGGGQYVISLFHGMQAGSPEMETHLDTFCRHIDCDASARQHLGEYVRGMGPIPPLRSAVPLPTGRARPDAVPTVRSRAAVFCALMRCGPEQLERALDAVAGTGAMKDLAAFANTDKGYLHGYYRVYEGLLAPLRWKPLRMLEIGMAAGGSMRMWWRYLPHATLFAVDVGLHPRCQPCEHTPEVFSFGGDQADAAFLRGLVERTGGAFDLIIDDGGHHIDEQLTSLRELFPSLNPGGLYVIEDIETSYWTNDEFFLYGRPALGSFVDVLKLFPDTINRVFHDPSFEVMPGVDQQVAEVTFAQNMIVLRKVTALDAEFQPPARAYEWTDAVLGYPPSIP